MASEVKGFTPKQVLELIKSTPWESENQRLIAITQCFFNFVNWTDEDYKSYDVLLVNLKHSYRKSRKKTKEEEKLKTKQKGDALENIVNFIINKSFFLQVFPNKRTATHEIDQFITLTDYGKQAIHEYNFTPEMLGFDSGYFLGECKNYDDEIAATWVGKFYTLLKTCGNCGLGIIFSYKGLTGQENNWYDAHGLTKVIYQLEKTNKETFILDFNIKDFESLKDKSTNLFKIITAKKNALKAGVKSKHFLNETHEGKDELEKIFDEVKNTI